MSDNKFRDYLLSRQWSGIESDFVDDAQDDTGLPDAKSWEELEDYLKDKHAVPGALEAAEYIWKLYVASTHGQEV